MDIRGEEVVSGTSSGNSDSSEDGGVVSTGRRGRGRGRSLTRGRRRRRNGGGQSPLFIRKDKGSARFETTWRPENEAGLTLVGLTAAREIGAMTDLDLYIIDVVLMVCVRREA
jgi:hypothetical protein